MGGLREAVSVRRAQHQRAAGRGQVTLITSGAWVHREWAAWKVKSARKREGEMSGGGWEEGLLPCAPTTACDGAAP